MKSQNVLRLIWVLFFNLTYADGIQSLNKFLTQNTVRAQFEQTVFSKKKKLISSGSMQIARPNKFKWEYTKDGQLIISDGVYIYIYDQPLKQVTKRKIGAMLGRSPALLLAGNIDIKKHYTLKSMPADKLLNWVQLVPNDANDNNGFREIKIGFNKKTQSIAQMKFIDSFDNLSTITFSHVEEGIIFPPGFFSFKLKSGVDLIEQ